MITERYNKLTDLPSSLPVFPLRRIVLLPRTTLPFNIFEPRYLQMVDDVLGGERLIGLIQPGPRSSISSTDEAPNEALDKTPEENLDERLGVVRILAKDHGRFIVPHAGVRGPIRHPRHRCDGLGADGPRGPVPGQDRDGVPSPGR